MNWHVLDIRPRDLLFFRDAKPMRASQIGYGDRWPLPNILHDALLTAFHERWPGLQTWERKHTHARLRNDRNFGTSSLRFGGLRTVGVFPTVAGEVHFPVPLDVGADGLSLLAPCDTPGESNLPAPLVYPVAAFAPPAKAGPPAWISRAELARYLRGDAFWITEESALFDVECRVGIGVSPIAHSAINGAFYRSRYLRLRDSAGLRSYAMCDAGGFSQSTVDVVKAFFPPSRQERIVLGGQRGIVHVTDGGVTDGQLPAVNSSVLQGHRVKWVLLTPAVFTNGWLPNWIDAATGRVLLKRGERPPKADYTSRAAWRSAISAMPTIGARLAATRIGSPLPVSGWSLRAAQPKKTHLAVPAGSVYYFETASRADARALVDALSGWHCRSDRFGEKGFGMGVCGTWRLHTICDGAEAQLRQAAR